MLTGEDCNSGTSLPSEWESGLEVGNDKSDEQVEKQSDCKALQSPGPTK